MKIEPELIQYLLSNGGPILRWRAATELVPEDGTIDHEALRSELLDCAEVKQWLNLLGTGPVHHSKDSSAENVLAKLGENGLQAGMPALDQRASQYCAIGEGEPYHDEALILVPFLVRLGFSSEPRVASWITQRIDLLYEQSLRCDYDLYMSQADYQNLPPSQRKLHGNPKLFYGSRFHNHWGVLGLPTCYDLYALAYLPKADPLTKQKVETIVEYLLNPVFQMTPGGYIWNQELHRAYAAGRVFLACLPTHSELQKLVLFMELMAQFECGRASDWFCVGMSHLETFRTVRGTYLFPRMYLSEKPGYYLYAGMHMGLGEWPRSPAALELESTFRMLRLKKLAG